MNNKRYYININSMYISSIDTFSNINGRCNNGNKDVYFMCYFGCNNEREYKESIENMEKKYSTSTSINNECYTRVNHLNYVMNNDEISKYVKVFEDLSKITFLPDGSVNCNTLNIANVFNFKSESIKNTVLYAYKDTLSKFEKHSTNMNESLKRNFAVKILFWFDKYAKNLINKKENYSISSKFVYFGDIKLHGYLFLYFLAMSGVDVCWLNPSLECTISDELLKLANVKKDNRKVNIQLAEYDPKKYIQSNSNANKNIYHTGSNNIGINNSANNGFNNNRKVNAQYTNTTTNINNNTNNNANSSINGNNTNNNAPLKYNEKRELEPVELARMAESIVMIYSTSGDSCVTGSGVMIDERGYILTNNHVIRDASYFHVRIEGDDNVYGSNKLIRYDKRYDLAIIRIDRRCKPIPIYKGNKPLVRGQKVVAIGSPLGLFNTVSDGIISGFREIEEKSMIQFTAPISSGSSGGALLDMYGNLIGINTCGIDSGENLNFAVDYSTILSFVSGIITI